MHIVCCTANHGQKHGIHVGPQLGIAIAERFERDASVVHAQRQWLEHECTVCFRG